MNQIHTWNQGRVTIDLHQESYEKLLSRYGNVTEFIEKLEFFNSHLAKDLDLYNISAYPDHINKGIHVIGRKEDFGIFPISDLAIKCSQGKPCAENLRKQFYRSIQLQREFEKKLNPAESKLLQICPVYCHFQTRKPKAYFKQMLFMHRVKSGLALGDTETGFSQEFCRVFDIPTLAEIKSKFKFKLHLYLDSKKHRQILKIQAVYLFKKLQKTGINIWSLNQKNIMIDRDQKTGENKYIIIDPSADFFPPITPVYNAFTSQLCN
ncbi:MAG TPA: hypothetical protein DCY88_07605 [Cyanobacteria bacterium UBA11372]|nr:hypothetical protein [Cyanobacteria bacterium UBA11372]